MNRLRFQDVREAQSVVSQIPDIEEVERLDAFGANVFGVEAVKF